jgi:OPT family small oligopeptide transporter
MRWFMCCFGAMFVYYWFPGYIVQAMSYFNWMTWIAPDNVNVAAITGSVGGIGLNPFPTLDWNQLTYAADPLVFPFYTTFNGFLGTLITAPIVLAIWYTNTWNTAYIPINDHHVWDNTGSPYEVLRVVDNDTTLFNEEGYNAYSPAYLSAGKTLYYGVYFALYTATITHTILYHRREMVAGFGNLISRKPAFAATKDVHTRLMRSYREVPEYVYFGVLVASMALGAAGVGAFPTHTSPAVVLYGGMHCSPQVDVMPLTSPTVFLAVIFCVPCGIILSVTNNAISLSVIAELFGGLWFPGNATAMNYFKVYGFATTSRAIYFSLNLKLAHYVHIAPWVTFNCQMWATFVSTLVCTAIFNYQMIVTPSVCLPSEKDYFACPEADSFFTASVLWGTLGPKKMFGPGAIYNSLLWWFPLGAVLPIPLYFLRKKFKIFAYFHAPIFLSGGLVWAQFNMAYVWPAVPIAYAFNYYIKRRYLGWWSKYN